MIYHTISRVVGRDFVLEVDEREHFRMLMRMCEKFTGCRVLSYCLMSNHFHILLEVPPMPEGGISDPELLERLGVFYNEVQVAEIVKEMEDAAVVRMRGEFEMPPVDEMGVPLTAAEELVLAKRQAGRRVEEIRSRFTRRMHDLSEFMKSLLERFSKMVQPHAFADRDFVGRPFQERDRGKWDCGADDCGVYRFEPG